MPDTKCVVAPVQVQHDYDRHRLDDCSMLLMNWLNTKATRSRQESMTIEILTLGIFNIMRFNIITLI